MTFSDELTAARMAARLNYIEKIREAASFLNTVDMPGSVKQVDEAAPDFALTAPSGKTVVLSDLLQRGPVVISFFRGEWCPFCHVKLRAMLAAQPAMDACGATLLLISPEPPSPELVASVATLGGTVSVLHDTKLGVALTYGLVYLIPAALRQHYLDIDFDIPKMFDSGSWLMPLPSDFVVRMDGRIALSYADADFTVRLDPEVILETLRRLPS